MKSTRRSIRYGSILWLGLLLAAVRGIPASAADAQPPKPARQPLVRSVDLSLGQSAQVQLCDGSAATVKLLDLQETRDPVIQAVRQARVKVEVNGQIVTLTSATYHLPVTVAGVQIDCPITKGYTANSTRNAWALHGKDARLRLWPVGSPLKPGTAIEHRYARPGSYVVRVERVDEHGHKATARLHVAVE